MDKLRLIILGFHSWSSSPILIPRSLLLLVVFFVSCLTMQACLRASVPKQLKICPDGSQGDYTFL